MRLVSKTPKNANHFWVEEFTPEDRKFFESLGFKLVPPRGPEMFGFKDTLEYQGNGMYGFWSGLDIKTIFLAVDKHYDNVEIEQFYSH